MNIYRQMAADYSELARQSAVYMAMLQRTVKDTDSWSRYARWQARKHFRLERAKVIAYAEQVEHHLEDAAIKENIVYHCEIEGQKFCVKGQECRECCGLDY